MIMELCVFLILINARLWTAWATRGVYYTLHDQQQALLLPPNGEYYKHI